MKKLKGVAAVGPIPHSVGFEDPRSRFRFQSLLQDHQDLVQETDAIKKRMQTMEQRKLALLAEVRFLRWRFEYLTKDNSLRCKYLQNPSKVKSRDSKIGSKQIAKKRNYAVDEASPGFKYNKKPQIANGKKAVLQKWEPQFIEKGTTGKMGVQENFTGSRFG
ncbi:hypothetical protein SAY87_005566 [Trapa incisa]|uniref:Uncharacterized protein n=1 Tax=Trapa incisa TaxID=236973 RepID=A0AAN7KA32_9MYRT|nr:hypothetical protein SAY87_005566 [Trapa incisa]